MSEIRSRLAAVLVLSAGLVAATEAGTSFKLYDPGTEDIVDYEKYGEFQNVGTKDFRYVIKDRAGLAKASGEGVDPCSSITNNPDYKAAKASGALKKGDYWKRVNTSNPQLDYFVWNEAPEDPGVRLLFVGKAMEKGGHYFHALKAYRAAMVLYPDSACWSAGAEFQWDIATAAWNSIQNLLRLHPELNLRLVGADVVSRADPSGLTIVVTPGRLERILPPAEAQVAPVAVAATAPAESDGTEAIPMEGADETAAVDATNETAAIGSTNVTASAPADPNAIISQRGSGVVQFVQYGNKHWRMTVDGKPYFIKGMNYAPVRIGVVPWEWNWLWSDENTNGVIDSFEVWVDANKNNKQDADEPTTSDYQLLQDMGCNTIRLYLTDPELANLNIMPLRKMFHDHGIRVVVGNFIGAYCNGSGANWDLGTDYTIRKQRDNMKASVSNMVMKLRGESWVLAYILGNENNMEMSGDVNATRTNASKYPETFARFLNEIAKMIHELDPNHPVGIGNLLTGLVEYYGKLSPEIDFLGINSYIGEEGFGATWQKVAQTMDRPVVITEFGCDAYWTEKGPDEQAQATYLTRNWEDIVFNRCGNPAGAGNSIGGFLFEYVDEWWKDSLNYFEDATTHQSTRAVFPMPFADGFAQEEWFGVMSQGSGQASPYQRVPRQAYETMKALWTKEID